ncbi:hypothetical protein [Roseimaritima ulvae]|uniref:Spore coat protein U domain-containing protein n=2 Tax=Roseimaritima ulvae TaxID=980254 RepID=A0A5B9R8R7_9BACT|nr:hypothetical protein [Roseimaritima ulvae]QEG43261.1 hypothetical protein UC8_53080 [Roseimaritima ulvae]
MLGVLGVAGMPSASGQSTASLEFCAQVQNSLAILAPNGPVNLIHDGTAGLKSFAPQTFSILCNDADGATVTFSTLAGFTHNVLPLVTRDIQLNLAISSADAGSGWTVDTASDQTDLSLITPDLVAEVQASSSAPGNAELELTVVFDTGSLSTLVPGTYCATVYGTISAN